MTSKKNSFVTIAEEVQLLNNNSVELLTSLNKIVSSSDSSINVSQLDDEGKSTTYSLPTVGKLQKDINTLNNNVKRLSGMNSNNLHIIDGNSTKKIIVSDLNREPNKINSLNVVSEFNSTNNWFFESMMNPLLSVNFDLSDKVASDVDGVISRRYIVSFERDEDGVITDKGTQAKNEFNKRFIGKDDITLKSFTDWYTNSTNTGVMNNKVLVYDEQEFKFDFQEVQEHGIFSVLSQESDTINNKLWFHIYPYKYSTVTGEEKVIKNGDELVLNKDDSVTRWTVLETSTSSSEFRVRLERIEGYDPVPTGANTLRFYGNSTVSKNVRVTVGFDEYLVIFMKPTNSKNMIKGSIWSKGTGIYTNDLALSTDSNVSMAQYYLDTVYDYGQVLKDLIQKTIPSQYGITPNAPVLTTDNFKVVQINKHLTDTSDSKELKDLHSQKNKSKTKLEQVNSAISQKNSELSVKKYSSVAEKNKSQNELTKLVLEQESLSKSLYSVTTQIKSQTDTLNTASPKYKLRGFWAIPDAKQESGYREQEVIQFKIQYRYSAKNGLENQTEGYSIIDGDSTETGYFSNWTQITSDIRKRTFDNDTQTWTWELEDVSDADTPNINQLDVTISQDEKIEVRVKSISEVGYPDSLIESEWSNILVSEFPDDLNNVLDENSYILKEAEQDSTKIEFEQTLDSKGINKHVIDSFTNGDEYIAHTDDKIQTNIKDVNGTAYNVREYLEYLTSKIADLEAIVYSAKGVLKVAIFNGVEELEVSNNSITNIDFIGEDYGTTTDGVNYKNNLYINSDFYVKLENVSNSDLNFLVRNNYDSGNTIRNNDTVDLPALVDTDNNFIIQEANQFIYFCDNASGENLYEGDIPYIVSSEETSLRKYLSNSTKNAGLSSSYINKGRTGNTTSLSYSALGETIDDKNDWDATDGGFCTLICPQVSSIDDLIVDENSENSFKMLNSNSQMIIPFNIFWKFVGDDTDDVNLDQLTNLEHNKSLRIRLKQVSSDTYFDFVVKFNIKRKNI